MKTASLGVFGRLWAFSGLYPIDAQRQSPDRMCTSHPHMATSPRHRQRGQLLLEGRKHPRTAERFLVQVSSVHDPLLTELALVENHSPNGVRLATERLWELGSQVDMRLIAGGLKARARVVYCTALGPKKFAVGLNIILSHDGQVKPPTVH